MALKPKPILRERFYIYFLLLCGFGQATAGLVWYALKTAGVNVGRTSPAGYISVGAIFLIAVTMITAVIYLRRLHKWLRSHHYQVCLNCRYPLSALPPQGRCPECGTEYTHQATEDAWLKSWATKVRAPLPPVL